MCKHSYKYYNFGLSKKFLNPIQNQYCIYITQTILIEKIEDSVIGIQT